MVPQMTRLMIIFGVLVLLYFVVRWIAKPESFYWFGHYRGEALAEAVAQPLRYAPVGDCADCHDEEARQNRSGPHRSISCQTCHDAGMDHVNDPDQSNILHPEPSTLCILCHSANHSRPRGFPQVVVADHAEGMECNDCHMTHNPGEFQ